MPCSYYNLARFNAKFERAYVEQAREDVRWSRRQAELLDGERKLMANVPGWVVGQRRYFTQWEDKCVAPPRCWRLRRSPPVRLAGPTGSALNVCPALPRAPNCAGPIRTRSTSARWAPGKLVAPCLLLRARCTAAVGPPERPRPARVRRPERWSTLCMHDQSGTRDTRV